MEAYEICALRRRSRASGAPLGRRRPRALPTATRQADGHYRDDARSRWCLVVGLPLRRHLSQIALPGWHDDWPAVPVRAKESRLLDPGRSGGVIEYRLADERPEGLRAIMTHVVNQKQLSVGDQGCRSFTAAGGDERVIESMDDEGRDV